MDINQQYLWVLGFALVLGYVLLHMILMVLPKKLRADHDIQRQEVLKAAHREADIIRAEAQARVEEEIQLARDELKANAAQHRQDVEAQDRELAERELLANGDQSRVDRRRNEIDSYQNKVDAIKEIVDESRAKVDGVIRQFQDQLEAKAEVSRSALQTQMVESQVEDRQLQCQKVLKLVQEELSASSLRRAKRMLAKTTARYAPQFYWPKMINHVEIGNERLVDTLSDEQCELRADLAQLAEVDIELICDPEKRVKPVLKFAGGMGIKREAARLTAQELLARNPSSWGKAKSLYERNLSTIEAEALKLGQRAVFQLQLAPMHREIKKMIGSLNWRTSYRQNQYLHTVEVAQMAGILAHELGVDPEQAKRVGLLHDIGKSIDYRIEGSHAVISGDYADRFGESRVICDTVMSHHNDLIVETPLAEVLKSADTLSGARPGARVNLEEGYHVRLSGIDEVVRRFPGTMKSVIMNGGREVHVEVNHKKVAEEDLPGLSAEIARRIEEEVSFPGQIKVLVTRRYEAVAVA